MPAGPKAEEDTMSMHYSGLLAPSGHTFLGSEVNRIHLTPGLPIGSATTSLCDLPGLTLILLVSVF